MSCMQKRFFLLTSLLMVAVAQAYTPTHHSSRSTAARNGSGYVVPPSTVQNHRRTTMHFPSFSPTSHTAPTKIVHNMLKNVGTEQERGSGCWRLSNSVLASCDTLPRFPTAHGILSPQTVSRMEEMTKGGKGNEAVATFLKAYRRDGPVSCLNMLSDPEILPHLTKAMRDIAV